MALHHALSGESGHAALLGVLTVLWFGAVALCLGVAMLAGLATVSGAPPLKDLPSWMASTATMIALACVAPPVVLASLRARDVRVYAFSAACVVACPPSAVVGLALGMGVV